MMKPFKGKLRLPVNGEETTVPGAEGLKCPKCHEMVLDLSQARRLNEMAVETYRKKHGLLSSGEIKAIRSHFRLKQEELARLLKLGPNTISRWESGRNAQTAAMDVLLRMIRDLPGSFEFLRELAA
jgi:putative zinc finger/helix-turn-helix YgiT family protein